MTKDVPICFDCRHLDLRLENGNSYHWCTKTKKRINSAKVTQKACKHFKPMDTLDEVRWP